MSDARSLIERHLVLHRIDLAHGVWRFYALMLELDLFGSILLVRSWSRIGTDRQQLVEIFPEEIEAGMALEVLAQLGRRGYRGQ